MTAQSPLDDQGRPFRTEPFNLEAEQALLGALLRSNDVHDRVSNFLEPHHFRDPLHQQIYETAVKLIAAGKVANPITLKTFFENAERIDATLTVPAYLGRLAANATTIINAREYAQTIFDLAVRRNLILIGEDMVNAAYDSPVDFPPKQQIEEAETRLFSLAEMGRFGGAIVTFNDYLARAVDTAERAYKRGDGLSGLSTTFASLNRISGGLHPSDLVILAGRPSMGKTALAANIAFNLAMARHASLLAHPALRGDDPQHDGAAVAFFSLEMSGEQVANRILSERIGVSSERIRRGLLDKDEWKALIKARQELHAIPLYIDEDGGLSIAQVSARSRKLKRQKGIGLVVVDYLQLLSGASAKSGGRVQEVSEITNGLKALAKELNVPVLALCQLNRKVEDREDKRPQLADLRESGAIEQEADVVAFVYREAYYHERKKPAEGTPEFQDWMTKMQKIGDKAEIIFAKQRHGPIGSVMMKFEAEVTRFSDLAAPNSYADIRR